MIVMMTAGDADYHEDHQQHHHPTGNAGDA